MALSKEVWIGLGVGAAALGGLFIWSRKASAATPRATPGTTTTTTPATPIGDGGLPPSYTYPPIWTAPPVPPPGSGWVIPPGWIPPKGWTPPWATPAPTTSALPSWLTGLFGKTPMTPAGTDAVSDDFKIGFNDGLMDGASTDKASTATYGPNRRAIYATSPTYKTGYDRGWHEARVDYSKVAGVGAGMPRQWWAMLPHATAADYGIHPYQHPWRG